MYYKEIKGLTDLCLQASQKTDASICFTFNTSGYTTMRICIKDNGCVPSRGKYDGDYTIYQLPELKEITERYIQAARDHLTRLIKEAEETEHGTNDQKEP